MEMKKITRVHHMSSQVRVVLEPLGWDKLTWQMNCLLKIAFLFRLHSFFL